MSEHIVIAEDDEDLAFVLREALRRQRYEIDVAPTAGGLLDRLKATPYDLILLGHRRTCNHHGEKGKCTDC